MAAKKSQPKKRSTKRSAKRSKPASKRFLLRGLSGLAGIAATLLGIFLLYCVVTLPPVAGAFHKPKPPTVTFLDNSGEVVAVRGGFQTAVGWNDLPQSLVEAVIATEDRRFFKHSGFDLRGIGRAMVVNIAEGGIRQGGSTITQQLAKNLFLLPKRNLTRKVQELILALWLETKFSKQEILTLYLNKVYMGTGTWGVGAASEVYFKKHVSTLNLYESALLAGLLKAPSKYSPARSSNQSSNRGSNLAQSSNKSGNTGNGGNTLTATRTAQVLANMEAAGFITARQRTAAKPTKLRFTKTAGLGYFLDWIAPQIGDYTNALGGDLVVHTTINSRIQNQASQALNKVLLENRKAKKVSQGAVLLLGKRGEVVAMVGGDDYQKTQFNRTFQAKRQSGSAFKPIVYLTALENGFSPTQKIEDTPFAIKDHSKMWSPQNFDGKFYGSVTMEDALAKSLNVATARLSEQIGRHKVIETAHSLGVISKIPDSPSIALGTAQLSMLELTAAYATIAAEGSPIWAWGIAAITDQKGKTLYHRQTSGIRRVIPLKANHQLTKMLSYAVANGTARKGYFGYPMAAKTGTSQNFRDAWFVGWTAEYTAAVWLGNDNDSPMNKVTGGSLPALVWRSVMEFAHRGLPKQKL